MPISSLHPNNTRSSDFRFVFSDVAGVQFNGIQGISTFGIVRNPSDPIAGGAEEQVAVGMTAMSLKALSYSLSRLVDNFEKTTGTEIALADEMVRIMDEAIAKAAAAGAAAAKK